MRVLHLSTSDAGGGAARAAHRLHTGLRGLGVDSHMLVLQADAAATRPAGRWRSTTTCRPGCSGGDVASRAIERDFAAVKPHLPAGFEWFSDDRSEVGYGTWCGTVVGRGPWDVINLHWVGGLLDHEAVLHPRRRPACRWCGGWPTWAPLTGGCHYDGGCGKFAQPVRGLPGAGLDR